MSWDAWQAEMYCIVASTALLWFDWTIMLPLEGRRIWKRKFTGATAVYLLNRYTALFRRIFLIMEALSRDRSDQSCGGLTHADDALLTLNYFAFAAFTVIRVYAVWGRDWKPLLVVIPLSLARPVLFLASSILYIPAQGWPLSGCIRIYTLPDDTISKYVLSFQNHHLETISVVTTVTSEGIFLALTWVRTYGIKKDWSRLGVHTPLTTLLLRDGTAYFVTLFPSKVLAIISDLSTSPTLFLYIWPFFDEALTVCFLCRFMLDLRGVYFSDDLENELLERTAYLSNLRFSSSVAGNVGAALSPGSRFRPGGSGEGMAHGFDSLPSSVTYNDDDDDEREVTDSRYNARIGALLDGVHLPC